MRLFFVIVSLTAFLLFDGIAPRAQVQPGATSINNYPIAQSLTIQGTSSGPLFENVLQCNPDTFATTSADFVTCYSFSDYFGGGATQGGRQAMQGVAVLTAPSNPASPFRAYTAGNFVAWATTSDNGTGVTAGTSAGSFYGIGSYFIANSGATNLAEMTGGEVNSIAKTGSSMYYKNLWSLVGGGALDQVQGSVYDVMLALSAQPSSIGFQDGILIGSMNGKFPLTTTGTVMRTFDAVSIKDGINLNSLTISNCPFQSALFSVCQNSMALGSGAPVQSGVINVVENAPGVYPTSGTTSYAFSDNFSNGNREVDFWNSDILAGSPSFNFYQKTGASAATLEASLASAGLTLGKSIPLIVSGATSGTTTLQAPAVASGTLTLPAATDTLVGKATTDTLTNKTATDEINQEFEVSTAPISYTSNVTLATVTGLSQALTAGKTYNCHGHLTVTGSLAAGGIRVATVGTGSLTATSSSFVFMNYNGTTLNAVTTETTLGTAAATTLAVTDIFIDGAIVVNVGGTINVQAAQSVSSTTPTTVGQNSTFSCVRVN